MVYLFDAANTLIYKPLLSERFLGVLTKNGFSVDEKLFWYHHKIISEAFIFPDKTSQEFYHEFNATLLFSFGIVPEDELLNQIFESCTYLPWTPFSDTEAIKHLAGETCILSNFHKGLTKILDEFFPGQFERQVISETSNFRKPDVRFYQEAVSKLGVSPEQIIYVGDSPKLDLKPALEVGMNAYIIDRENFYPSAKRRISSLAELIDLKP
jgi:HAD superfamily hydrolase (TIGR01509 family)